METLRFKNFTEILDLEYFELSNLENFIRGLDLNNFTIEFGLRQFECSDLKNLVWFGLSHN